MKHIFEEGEMGETSVILKSPTIGSHGRNYPSIHYYLGIIISLGYCMKSFIATSFQCGATEGLKKYTIKGFIMDNEWEKSRWRDIEHVEEAFMILKNFFW